MDSYDIAEYGEKIADVYDEWHAQRSPEAAVDVLAELAGDGRALELGVGTGRVALALAARGVPVEGIEASAAMVARLREKPGGDIPVVIGNFADVAVEGTFSVVFAVFASFFGLPTQDEQVRCFMNVAAHLSDGGTFVIETFVPDHRRLAEGQTAIPSYVGMDDVELVLSRHDTVRQRIRSQKIRVTEQGVRLCPVDVRYVWPSELDLMARLAGMRLRSRWAGWHGQPFVAESREHVSIYELSRGRRDAA